jgi:hypothetical protein
MVSQTRGADVENYRAISDVLNSSSRGGHKLLANLQAGKSRGGSVLENSKIARRGCAWPPQEAYSVPNHARQAPALSAQQDGFAVHGARMPQR